MKLELILVLATLAAAPLFGQESLRDRYMATTDLFINKDYRGAVQADKAILGSANVPLWMQIACYGDLAAAHAQLGETDAALAAFEKAVSLGYNDYIGVQRGGLMNPLFSNPRFLEIYGRMKISPMENAELVWFHSEIQAEIHDMNMMITENMNRKDDAFTEVFLPRIPAHPSTPSIQAMREILAFVQSVVRNNVMQSDQSRIMHLTNMAIIDAMPGGSSTDATSKQTERLLSMEMARQRAASRRQAVAQREFAIPAGASKVQQPVPAFGK